MADRGNRNLFVGKYFFRHVGVSLVVAGVALFPSVYLQMHLGLHLGELDTVALRGFKELYRRPVLLS